MTDLSSFSRPDEALVTHLDWKIAVAFSEERLFGEATYKVVVAKHATGGKTSLNLDTSSLDVTSCTDGEGNPLKFTLHPVVESKPHLEIGRAHV